MRLKFECTFLWDYNLVNWNEQLKGEVNTLAENVKIISSNGIRMHKIRTHNTT